MSKKKIGIVIGVIAVIVLCGLGIGFREQIAGIFTGEKDTEDRVYVEQIATMNGQMIGMTSRFNGVVETQDVYEVKVDSSRKIERIHVKVGDVVKSGQTLVTYDISELKLQLEQANLEKESILNDIANEETQIKLITQQMASVSTEEKFTYNTQIQNIQNSISQKKYDLESKQLEIDKITKQINHSTEKSKVSGTVKAINERGVDKMGNSAPFMSILQSGDYRVKGSVDEQNIWSISEGQSVILRSRVNQNQIWSGTISKIDTDNVQQNTNEMYGGGEVMMASKYPFYVELENSDGLILGQHLYIELDEGQTEVKDGIWLYSFYVVQDEDGAYVWASNAKNRLEKRMVELGEYDEAMEQYQILSGLSNEDYIAWPMDGLYEGVTTVTNMEDENWNYETDENLDVDMNDYMDTEAVEGTEWY